MVINSLERNKIVRADREYRGMCLTKALLFYIYLSQKALPVRWRKWGSNPCGEGHSRQREYMQRPGGECILSCPERVGSDPGNGWIRQILVSHSQTLAWVRITWRACYNMLLDLNPRASKSVGLGRGPTTCISHKFMAVAAAAAPVTTLWEPLI